MTNTTTLLYTRSIPDSKPALLCPGRGVIYTYGRLRREVNSIGNGLLANGVKRGDRVCIYLGSVPEYLVSYFAIWRIGAVAVPTNIGSRGEELLHVLADAGAVAVITDSSGIEVVRLVRGRAPHLASVIVIGAEGPDVIPWESLLALPEHLEPTHCSCEDLCHIQYTSGTTGRPKGAMLTHGNWMNALDTEREALRILPSDVYLGVYPMGHVGVSWGIAVIRAGGTYVIMERFALDQYLAFARKYQVTILAGMPPVIHSLLSSPQGAEDDLRTARTIISGGGPLLPALWEAFDQRFHIPVANSYGLSETIVIGSGTITLPDHPQLTGGYRSVGVAVGYTEVSVRDENDPVKVLMAGETGEIALRGPSVAKGYWNLKEETDAVFLKDGWFLTGDIGHMDKDGLLFITDRKKDMIVMSGWKIYPTEVENVLIRHPLIADAAVFSIPDEHRGEIPAAALVPVRGASLDEESVIAFCRENLAGYKVPRRIVSVESLPRIHGWKILRRELRERFSG